MALRPRAAQQHVHGTSGQRAVASAAAAALTGTRVQILSTTVAVNVATGQLHTTPLSRNRVGGELFAL